MVDLEMEDLGVRSEPGLYDRTLINDCCTNGVVLINDCCTNGSALINDCCTNGSALINDCCTNGKQI